MKKVEFEVYNFSELSETAQKVAIEKEMEKNRDDTFYCDMVTESLLELCNDRFGLDVGACDRNKKHDLSMEYSLSYCQGDGVALYGQLDKEAIVKMLQAIKKYNDSLSGEKFIYVDDEFINEIMALPISELQIERNHYGRHYTHINCMEFTLCIDSDLEGEELELLELKADKLAPQFKDVFRYIVGELENEGYSQFKYYHGEEFAKEELECKDGEQFFTEDGLFHSWA